MISIHITGESTAALTAEVLAIPAAAEAVEAWAIAFLREREFVIARHSDWETPAEFIARIGCSIMTFNRRATDPRNAHLFVAHRGPSGRRILQLSSTPEFDALCRDQRRHPDTRPA